MATMNGISTRLEVLASEVKTYPAKEGRAGGQYQVCQCVIRGNSELGTKTLVGELRVFGEMGKGEPIAEGEYFAEFGLAVDWKDKSIGGQLTKLTPVNPKPGMKSPVPAVSA